MKTSLYYEWRRVFFDEIIVYFSIQAFSVYNINLNKKMESNIYHKTHQKSSKMENRRKTLNIEGT